MKRISDIVTFKFREKASVFLTELHPAVDGAARADVMASIRKRDYDATHHCSAWREGFPVAAFGADDDGEPSGTAGSPMLRVLEGQELTDILAVCIRWYGGTKLGKGGLVKAYTTGVQGAIAEGLRLGHFLSARMFAEGSIEAPPETSHLPFSVLASFKDVEILSQDFGATLTKITFRLPVEDRHALELAWKDRSRGGEVAWESQTSM